MKKKVVSLFLVLLFCFVGAGAIDISFDGDLLPLKVAPVVQGEHTMVPFRDFMDALQTPVKWDAATQTVSAHSSGSDLFVRIGANKAIGGKPKQ